jgi:alkanesulfonate monooxygenase SsuD/methylene tetrahydromethanopterin reductase-like flavin-dependent oxidoreductase (luciferase family)
MQFGLNLPVGGVAGHPRILADFARVAEDAGWDGVYLEDYIVYQNRQAIPTFDPWIALAAIAIATTRMRIGTEVTPLARRRPWKLARETVTLDHLSNGRLTLGVGLGVAADLDFANFNEEQDNRRRAAQLDEALHILVGLWSGEPFSFTGQHFTVKETRLLPRPVQQPRIPIWVGGGYPNRGPMRRAARFEGACLYRAESPGSSIDAGSLPPDDIRGLRHYLDTHDSSAEIIVGGRKRNDDWQHERHLIQQSAQAGANSWIEWIPPNDPETMRNAIAHGPIRV